MAAFATVEDYAKRYGAVTDATLVTTSLGDAPNLLLSAYEDYWGEEYAEGKHRAFDRSAASVACKLANNAVSAPSGYEGATQVSQGAGGYTASVTYAGAVGSMWLGKSDLAALGLSGQRLRAIYPYERDEVTDDA